MVDDRFFEFTQASFPVSLNLPKADENLLEDARKAISREYRDSTKWKRLRCRDVNLVSKSDSGSLYELQIGHVVDFDWTWEGAVAFRPLLLKEFSRTQSLIQDEKLISPDIEDSILWSGEVIEVDEATGKIFVLITNLEHPPRRGSFYVRPYEFLAFLNSVYNDPSFIDVRVSIPKRLAAAKGQIHPEVSGFVDIGQEKLKTIWRKSWGVLWGPPGTGKTYTTGLQIAKVLSDPTERILVVSTTNRATDAAAIAIGRAVKKINVQLLSDGVLLRIGKGSMLRKFQQESLTEMLQGTEIEYLAEIEKLSIELSRTQNVEQRALLRKEIKEVREKMLDSTLRNFLDQSVRVVVSTSFKATTFLGNDEVKNDLEQEFAPFTTIFIDEAGLMSRVVVSALSLLASRRVVLVGDPKQLAPISRISRILEPSQGNWLACSGLNHLDSIGQEIAGVHNLKEQYRMHSGVCNVVSAFQYDGALITAKPVLERQYKLPQILEGQPRAIWYVLDEDGIEFPSIRAERGPGNRSWIRKGTKKILDKLFAEPGFRAANGLFISPFKAQAKAIHSYLASANLDTWMASTVHSQQGSEADIVIFDTVNAGSYAWPYNEWKRLINVALSRAREAIIVLSSRAEMDEPYLRPLLKNLSARVFKRSGGKFVWKDVPHTTQFNLPITSEEKASYTLGNQIAKRKELRPVLSQEQERLCGLKLDGKPRLVRGVAGSGKTIVLANWLIRTLERFEDKSNIRIWAVFANRSLQSLIGDSIVNVWEEQTNGRSFPWDCVSLRHIKELLEVMLPDAGLSLNDFGFDYDSASKAYLEVKSKDEIKPLCDALFIDEAQDMGPNTLRLLSAIVRQTETSDDNSRSINIFYDNAQNIYGRSTPKWSEFDLDMRGRSTVMKESFRSTRPITEFALNVLYRFQPPDTNPDHKELVDRGLVERSKQKNTEWWNVRFNQIDGPKPEFHQYNDLEEEFKAVGKYCRKLIENQGVQPGDICLIYNGKNIPYWLKREVVPQLEGLGVEVSVQTSIPYQRSNNTLLATTSHSFKGFDSEIVIIPAVDQYKANEVGVLANALYVAMTRARSILTLFSQKMKNNDAEKIYEVIKESLKYLTERSEVEFENTFQDDFIEILDSLGQQHKQWLINLWKKYQVIQEPLMTKNGVIVADPLFLIKTKEKYYVCYGEELPDAAICSKLGKYGVGLIRAGHPDLQKDQITLTKLPLSAYH